jgi:hypothetical protein
MNAYQCYSGVGQNTGLSRGAVAEDLDGVRRASQVWVDPVETFNSREVSERGERERRERERGIFC